MTLLLITIGLLVSGALVSALLARVAFWSSLLGSSLAALGSGLGFVFAFRSLTSGLTLEVVQFPWALPNASFTIGIDPLSSFFLLPLFLLGAVTAIYGHHYLDDSSSRTRRGLSFVSFNLLLASMALVLVARHVILFMVAWETMSLCAYMLVTYEHEQLEVRKAGFIYLVVAHLGVACLLALFLLLRGPSGSFEFARIAAVPIASYPFATGVFCLAILGFGVKAGLLPLHVWLPQAHAAAPSHVSALMSGVLIKLGIYGILRVALLLGSPRPSWGAGLLCLGALTAVFGIAMAAYQRDLKRVLAYSSIENMGIVALGLGLALWGRSTGHPVAAALGLVGALLHLYHHAVMKGLMFLLSGTVLHACHTKDLEQLGGLGKRMPVSFGLFVLGAVAISGLPPLNAFVSEWLLYSGLMRGALSGRGGGAIVCTLAVALLSLTGAIAALCFVRLLGVTMLGEPRRATTAQARESTLGLLLPMLPLALLIVAQGLLPDRFLNLISPVVRQLQPELRTWSVPSLGLLTLGHINMALMLAIVGAAAFGHWYWGKRRTNAVVPTWDCGYVAPTARMQYTARGMSELFTESVVPRRFGPKLSSRLPRELLPKASNLRSEGSDPLTRDVYEPFLARWADRFARLRWMQQGHLHIYLLYILMTLLAALAFSAVHSGVGAP